MDTTEASVIKLFDKMPDELVQYFVHSALDFINKTRPDFDSTELLSISEDEGCCFTLEEIRSLKNGLLNILRINKKKKLTSEDLQKFLANFLTEEKQGVVLKVIENYQENAREDIFHNEQLVDVKWSLKYIIQTKENKQINVPVISVQLLIADVDGEVQTEYLNMSLGEFQSFKGEIKRMTEVLK